MSTNTKLPPWRIGPDDGDVARHRTERRLLEIAEHRQREQDEAEIERLVQELVASSDPFQVAISALVTEPDGSRAVKRHVFVEATPEMRELATTEPHLATGVMWKNMDFDARRAFLRHRDRSAENIRSDDIFDVLSETDRDFLGRWQALINAGAAWNNAALIGELADRMVAQGFLLHGHAPTEGMFNRAASRNDALEAGSPAYVGAVMGEAYLAWIEAVP